MAHHSPTLAKIKLLLSTASLYNQKSQNEYLSSPIIAENPLLVLRGIISMGNLRYHNNQLKNLENQLSLLNMYSSILFHLNCI